MNDTTQIQINLIRLSLILLIILVIAQTALSQGTAFTYQGRLVEAGNPATGAYDMQFKIFDTPTVGTGTQQGSTIANPTVQVAAGSFVVQLDFGANVFDGSARYLEISVRPAGSPNPYTVLGPRPQITSAPYAIQTFNTQQLGGLPASRYVKTETDGNVAIGTGTPAHRLAVLGGPCWTGDCWGGALELDNASAIGWRANSLTKFGIGHTENGLFFFRTNSPLGTTTNGPIYDFKMDNAGNVGIGNLGISTDLSSAKLNLFRTGDGFGEVQTNGTVTLGSLLNSSGGWLGTRSNHPLHLFTNDGIPRITIGTNGQVGIGITTPFNANLHIETLGFGTGIFSRSPSGFAGLFDGDVRVVFGDLSISSGNIRVTTGDVYVNTNVGIGTDAPQRSLHVNGRARIGQIPLEAWNSHVCFNAAGDLVDCNFSSLRAKTNVHTFRTGLDIVRRLRPISFNWKENGLPSVGLGAEEVADVAPSLVERNTKGEVAGVKYERLNMLLINAIQEQQQLIEKLHAVNANLNVRLRALEKGARKRNAQRRGNR